MHYVLLIFALLSPLASAEPDCENAFTTVAINRCLAIELEAAEATLEEYLAKSRNRYDDDSHVIESLAKAQEAWLVYRESHCGSVHDIWRDGTIRGTMSISCSIRLARQRTHDVWTAYLTHADSRPPLLPEPKL